VVARLLVVVALALNLSSCHVGTPATASTPTTTNAPTIMPSPPTAAKPPDTLDPGCSVSPDTTYRANGHMLDGKRGGDMFIYPAAGRVFKADRLEKFLVFLDPLPASLPAPLLVRGRNRITGTATVFENERHQSEYGTEWGTNYLFPDAGCWELRVGDPRSQGMVIIVVMP